MDEQELGLGAPSDFTGPVIPQQTTNIIGDVVDVGDPLTGAAKDNTEPPKPSQNREVFIEQPRTRQTKMSTGRFPTRAGSRFFDLSTDPLNPVNAEFEAYIKETTVGTIKGDVSVIEPKSLKKYPKGFTPPTSFYQDQSYKYFFNSSTGELAGDTEAGSVDNPTLSPSDTGLINTNNADNPASLGQISYKRVPFETLPGRHKEYGISLTYYDENTNSIKVFGAGDKIVTKNFFEGGNSGDGQISQPGFTIDWNSLQNPKSRYVNPENYIPGTVDQQTGKGIPLEYGNIISSPGSKKSKNQRDSLNQRYDVYDKFDSYGSKNFLHTLDYFIDKDGNPSSNRIQATDFFKTSGRNGPWPYNDDGTNTNIGNVGKSFLQDVYLGGYFINTFVDNEDPTILGVDIRLKSENSPILNQAIEYFIRAFGSSYTEINSRLDILQKFREQLYKFIPSELPSFGGTWPGQPKGQKNAKIHYLQSVSGLDRLIEKPIGPEPKQFIDYGKDILTLEFLEDVGQNMGYLSSLYKMLSWSKISGKQMIPANLLKFDLEIRITEMRNFKKNVYDKTKTKNSLISFNDKISQYNYTLYECEFLFDKMPHTEMVKNNSGTEVLEAFKLDLQYKFSTLEFKRFDGRINLSDEGRVTVNYFILDNLKKNPSLYVSFGEELLEIERHRVPTSTDVENQENNAGKSPSSNDLATNTIPDGPPSTTFEQPEISLDQAIEEQALAEQEFGKRPAPSKGEFQDDLGYTQYVDPIYLSMKENTYPEGANRPVIEIRKALLMRTLLNIREQKPGFPGKIQGSMKPDADNQAEFKPPGQTSEIDSSISNNISNLSTKVNENTEPEARSFFQNPLIRNARGNSYIDLSSLDNFTNRSTKVTDSSKAEEKSFFQNPVLQGFKRDLKNAVANQINRVIIERARLLNNAIDDIRNQIPFAGRMSEPTNVYTSTNAFRNDIINSLRNLAGGAISSFFKKPI